MPYALAVRLPYANVCPCRTRWSPWNPRFDQRRTGDRVEQGSTDYAHRQRKNDASNMGDPKSSPDKFPTNQARLQPHGEIRLHTRINPVAASDAAPWLPVCPTIFGQMTPCGTDPRGMMR